MREMRCFVREHTLPDNILSRCAGREPAAYTRDLAAAVATGNVTARGGDVSTTFYIALIIERDSEKATLAHGCR